MTKTKPQQGQYTVSHPKSLFLNSQSLNYPKQCHGPLRTSSVDGSRYTTFYVLINLTIFSPSTDQAAKGRSLSQASGRSDRRYETTPAITLPSRLTIPSTRPDKIDRTVSSSLSDYPITASQLSCASSNPAVNEPPPTWSPKSASRRRGDQQSALVSPGKSPRARVAERSSRISTAARAHARSFPVTLCVAARTHVGECTHAASALSPGGTSRSRFLDSGDGPFADARSDG